jgi:flagellar basal body-associated protein FliL
VDGTQDKWGPWTDFYALGATLYNLLTKNRPPLTSDIASEGDAAFSYPYPVSPQMRQLISYMMQPVAKKRPQSADEIMAFLNGNVGMQAVMTGPNKHAGVTGPHTGPSNSVQDEKKTVVFNRFSDQGSETKAMTHQRQLERGNKQKRLLMISIISFLLVLAIVGTILLLHSKGSSKDTSQDLQTAEDAIMAVNDAKAKIENITDPDSLNALSADIQKKVDDLKKDLSDEDKSKVDAAVKDFIAASDARNEAIEPIIATKAFIKEFTEKCRKVKTVEEFQDLCTELEDRALELEEKYPYFEPTGADSLELVKLQEEFDKVVDEKSSEFEE